MERVEQVEMGSREAGVWLKLAIACAAFILIGAQDGAVGVLLPSLEAQYLLDKATVSTLFFASTCGYLLSAFTSGLLVEKLGEQRFLSLGGACFLIGAVMISTIPPWVVVLLALIALGFGIGTIDAGLNAVVAAMPDNTAKLNYLHACYGCGALIGPVLASTILATGLGWNWVHRVLAVLSTLVIAALLTGFRQIGAPNAINHAEARGGRQSNVLTAVLALPIVWLAAIFLLLYVGIEVSVGSWTYSVLTEQRGIGPLLSGWLVSGYWAGLTLGRLILGSVARRFGNVVMIQACLAGLMIGLLALWLVPGTITAGAALGLAGFSLGPIFPTMIALISQYVPQRLLPSAIGFMASLGAGGAAMFPWLAGTLAHVIGLWIVLPYAIVLTALLLGLWFLFHSRAAQSRGDATLTTD